MDPNSLINEAHQLERKSEEQARRGEFDDALHCCIAAAQCLVRLLSLDESVDDVNIVGGGGNGFIANDQIKDSVQMQISFLEKRQNLLTRKKQHFEYLKEIRTRQLREEREENERKESILKRRSSSTRGGTSSTDDRRRSGVVNVVPNTSSSANREEVSRLESLLDARNDSFSLLQFLDARGGGVDDHLDDHHVVVDFNDDVQRVAATITTFKKTPKTEADVMEELRLHNVDLRQHVLSLLKEVEKEKSKSAALEASLIEMSTSSSTLRLGGGSGGGRGGLQLHMLKVDEDGKDENVETLDTSDEKKMMKFNMMQLDLPPLELPTLDLLKLE